MITKISVIGGGGNIGRTIGYSAVYGSRKICDNIALIDVNGDVVKGSTLDIMQAVAADRLNANIIASSDYKDIEGSDVVIVSAGMPRKAGMTRDDLIGVNLKIIESISAGIKQYAPDAFIIIITNPLDAMVYAAHKFIGCPDNKIVGMAGVLDGARFAYQIGQTLNVDMSCISSMVIGAHNDTMLPLTRFTTVAGISIDEMLKMGMINSEQIATMIDKVKNGGAEIVKYLGNGSAYFNPAASSLLMAESYLKNKRAILSCSVLLKNCEYGVGEAIFVGVPVIIGGNGVEKIIELDLNESEKSEFNKSVDSIKDILKAVEF